MKTQLKIQMLGSSFSIQTDEPQEHLDKVLHFLGKKIDEILEKNAGIEPVKIALLAALNIADELLRLKRSLAQSGQAPAQSIEKIEAITRNLIERIDAALETDHP